MKPSRYVQEGEERVLALYFNTLGFAYTLMKSPIEVLDKGRKSITPVSNTETLQLVKRLIKKLRPECIVIEDYTGEASYKSKRIQELLKQVKRIAKQKGIPCCSYSRAQIRLVFSNWSVKSRYEIAQLISDNLEAYQNIFFEKPKYPRIEHYRSCLFDAASLAITHYYITQ